MKCVKHPAKEAVVTFNGMGYCANCKTAIGAVVVDQHVDPKPCFVTTDDGRVWRSISGTGCAHYVAHTLGIKGGGAGGTACLEGFIVPVRLLLGALSGQVISVYDVRVNDIWFNDETFTPQARARDHCGIVTGIIPGRQMPPLHYSHGLMTRLATLPGLKPMPANEFEYSKPTITITHCSSGQGGVFPNDWSKYFHSGGKFYRQ